MRLSEKTLELSICSQVAAALGRKVIWFGLTQRQEARAGFDACMKLGGHLVIFQFKASNTLRDNGATRRFRAPHLQMMALRRRAPHPRLVFYVLPDLGTTLDLTQGLDLLARTWLLDVATLPQLPPPTKEDGSLRRSGEHYIDLAPPWVTVHSDPVKVGAIQLDELSRQLAVDANDLPRDSRLSSEWLNADDWPFSRKSLALAIGPPSDAQGEKAP